MMIVEHRVGDTLVIWGTHWSCGEHTDRARRHIALGTHFVLDIYRDETHRLGNTLIMWRARSAGSIRCMGHIAMGHIVSHIA